MEELKNSFYYSEGKLYWKEGKVLANKEAGYKNMHGYIEVNITIRGKPTKFLAHRIIFYLHHGFMPKLVDHVDRNPQNNSISNLRAADKKLNSINTGLPKNNTSGVKGVSWNKACGKWSAQIKVDGKKKHLGTFSNLEDATKTRRQAERLYGFII